MAHQQPQVPTVINVPDLLREMTRLSELLDAAIVNLYEAGLKYADAENTYRMAKAKAYLMESRKEHTVAHCEAVRDIATERERLAAHIAEAYKESITEEVRSRRSQLSALQTISNALREELSLARTGPEHKS